MRQYDDVDPTDAQLIVQEHRDRVKAYEDALDIVCFAEHRVTPTLGYHPDLHPCVWPHRHEDKHPITRVKKYVLEALLAAEKELETLNDSQIG